MVFMRNKFSLVSDIHNEAFMQGIVQKPNCPEYNGYNTSLTRNQGQSPQQQQQGRSIARASATDLAAQLSTADRPQEEASQFVERGT